MEMLFAVGAGLGVILGLFFVALPLGVPALVWGLFLHNKRDDRSLVVMICGSLLIVGGIGGGFILGALSFVTFIPLL